MTRAVVVAIDGPAGSGKSTVARALATRLGLDVLDTGSMYRAVTALALREGLDPHDGDKVAILAREVDLVVGERVTSLGVDLTDSLRSDEVNRAVSVVAAHPAVRAALVDRQRSWVEAHRGGVVEGRDIGSVVFPHADVKVFLTASDVERARRRADDEHPESVARRDRLDVGRVASPLRPADDAHRLDTTGRPVEDVVEEILSWL
ncbi:MAG TPA: (d)CMP kinase [Acidimicrobiales bacterium]|jgi:cytidylate kinase